MKPALAQWDENKLKIAIKLINTVFERRANLKSLNGKRLKFDSLNLVEQCHGGRRFAGFEGRGPEREKWEMKIWILTNCSTYSSGRPSWPFWPETISVGADRVLWRLLNRNKTLTWMCCEIGLKILRKHIVKILNYGQKGPSSLYFPTIRKTSSADFRILVNDTFVIWIQARCRVVMHDCIRSTKKWKFVENVIFGYSNERFGGENDKKTPQGRFYLHIFEKMCATLLLFTYHSDNFNKSLYTFIRLESQCVWKIITHIFNTILNE